MWLCIVSNISNDHSASSPGLIDPEDEGPTVLQNVGLHYPIIPHPKTLKFFETPLS